MKKHYQIKFKKHISLVTMSYNADTRYLMVKLTQPVGLKNIYGKAFLPELKSTLGDGLERGILYTISSGTVFYLQGSHFL